MKETAKRSFAKAVSWRITASIATFLIAWIISSDFAVAGSIASVQLVINFILYFLHERIWNTVDWQRQ